MARWEWSTCQGEGENKRINKQIHVWHCFQLDKDAPSLSDTKWLTSVSGDWCTGLRRHNYCPRNARHNGVGISAVGIQTVWHLAAGIYGICHQSASLGQGLIRRTPGESNQAGVIEQDSAIQSYNLVQEKCYKLWKMNNGTAFFIKIMHIYHCQLCFIPNSPDLVITCLGSWSVHSWHHHIDRSCHIPCVEPDPVWQWLHCTDRILSIEIYDELILQDKERSFKKKSLF